jgi:hypothetical protein
LLLLRSAPCSITPLNTLPERSWLLKSQPVGGGVDEATRAQAPGACRAAGLTTCCVAWGCGQLGHTTCAGTAQLQHRHSCQQMPPTSHVHNCLRYVAAAGLLTKGRARVSKLVQRRHLTTSCGFCDGRGSARRLCWWWRRRAAHDQHERCC